MSTLSTLQFGDNETGHYSDCYRITHCHCRFNRTYDCCLPSSDSRCEQIEVTVVAPGKSDLNIVEWFIDGTPLSGRLLFDRSDDDIAGSDMLSSIEFEDAYCVSLSENYDIETSLLRQMSIVIVPMRTKTCDVEFSLPE